MYTIYNSIQELCAARGIKPGKMCTDIGMSRSILTDLKTGRKKSVNADTAKKIADYFGVSVDRVLGTEQKEKPAPNGNGLSEEEIKFIEWYRSQASEKDKALVRMIVEGE